MGKVYRWSWNDHGGVYYQQRAFNDRNFDTQEDLFAAFRNGPQEPQHSAFQPYVSVGQLNRGQFPVFCGPRPNFAANYLPSQEVMVDPAPYRPNHSSRGNFCQRSSTGLRTPRRLGDNTSHASSGVYSYGSQAATHQPPVRQQRPVVSYPTRHCATVQHEYVSGGKSTTVQLKLPLLIVNKLQWPLSDISAQANCQPDAVSTGMAVPGPSAKCLNQRRGIVSSWQPPARLHSLHRKMNGKLTGEKTMGCNMGKQKHKKDHCKRKRMRPKLAADPLLEDVSDVPLEDYCEDKNDIDSKKKKRKIEKLFGHRRPSSVTASQPDEPNSPVEDDSSQCAQQSAPPTVASPTAASPTAASPTVALPTAASPTAASPTVACQVKDKSYRSHPPSEPEMLETKETSFGDYCKDDHSADEERIEPKSKVTECLPYSTASNGGVHPDMPNNVSESPLEKGSSSSGEHNAFPAIPCCGTHKSCQLEDDTVPHEIRLSTCAKPIGVQENSLEVGDLDSSQAPNQIIGHPPTPQGKTETPKKAPLDENGNQNAVQDMQRIGEWDTIRGHEEDSEGCDAVCVNPLKRKRVESLAVLEDQPMEEDFDSCKLAHVEELHEGNDTHNDSAVCNREDILKGLQELNHVTEVQDHASEGATTDRPKKTPKKRSLSGTNTSMRSVWLCSGRRRSRRRGKKNLAKTSVPKVTEMPGLKPEGSLYTCIDPTPGVETKEMSLPKTSTPECKLQQDMKEFASSSFKGSFSPAYEKSAEEHYCMLPIDPKVESHKLAEIEIAFPRLDPVQPFKLMRNSQRQVPKSTAMEEPKALKQVNMEKMKSSEVPTKELQSPSAATYHYHLLDLDLTAGISILDIFQEDPEELKRLTWKARGDASSKEAAALEVGEAVQRAMSAAKLKYNQAVRTLKLLSRVPFSVEPRNVIKIRKILHALVNSSRGNLAPSS